MTQLEENNLNGQLKLYREFDNNKSMIDAAVSRAASDIKNMLATGKSDKEAKTFTITTDEYMFIKKVLDILSYSGDWGQIGSAEKYVEANKKIKEVLYLLQKDVK